MHFLELIASFLQHVERIDGRSVRRGVRGGPAARSADRRAALLVPVGVVLPGAVPRPGTLAELVEETAGALPQHRQAGGDCLIVRSDAARTAGQQGQHDRGGDGDRFPARGHGVTSAGESSDDLRRRRPRKYFASIASRCGTSETLPAGELRLRAILCARSVRSPTFARSAMTVSVILRPFSISSSPTP